MIHITDKAYSICAYSLCATVGRHQYVSCMEVMPLGDGVRGYLRVSMVVERSNDGIVRDIRPVWWEFSAQRRGSHDVIETDFSFDKLRNTIHKQQIY